jgi:hypothetical protein
MKCTDVRAALPLLIYGEPVPEDAALREHLAQCAACRREHEALVGVRRLLDDVPVPRVAVDLSQLPQSLTEREMRRARRWRRVAWTFGTVAAVLLLAIGLRLEVRVEASQLIVRWGEPPPPMPAPPPQPFVNHTVLPSESIEAELRVFSELIHALKRDADDRDQRFTEQIERLQKHVRALQTQADLRWNSTEENVAALYLLTRKGEKQ